MAYAKPGKECLYNIFIMEELQSILALGSGGSSKIVFPEENRMERVENVKSVDDYIGRISFIPVTGFFFNAITHYLQLSLFLLMELPAGGIRVLIKKVWFWEISGACSSTVS